MQTKVSFSRKRPLCALMMLRQVSGSLMFSYSPLKERMKSILLLALACILPSLSNNSQFGDCLNVSM